MEPITVWPWGHLIVGYLSYSLFTRWQYQRSPAGDGTVVLVVGTQFPDLVDKPLAWWLFLLPNGRSLTHSLIVAVVFLVIVRSLCQRIGVPQLSVAFGIGYLLHIIGDLVPSILYGMPGEWKFLFWPMLPPVDYDPSVGFYDHFAAFEITPFLIVEAVVGVFTVAVWMLDGAPGTKIRFRRRRR